MDALESVRLDNNINLEIFYDENPESPREWSNLGVMACFHHRYNLGDKHEFCNKFVYGEKYFDDTPQDLMEFIKQDNVISLPLYLYDHSGITISTQPFNDGWDSGMIGYIYVTKEIIQKEYGWKHITKNRIKKILQYLDGEVKIYDDYLTGNVYGFTLTCETCGEELDSCWGFFGNDGIKQIKEETEGYECKDCKKIIDRLDQQMAFQFV